MKLRLTKLALTLCSLLIIASAISTYAQDTGTNEGRRGPGSAFLGGRGGVVDDGPDYDIQIEKGVLSIVPLKDNPEVKAVWGGGKPVGVPATVGNLAKYLRIANTNLNLVISGDATDVKISDLKIHSSLSAIMEALSVATDGNIRARPAASRNAWFIMAQRPATVSHRTVEVFNVTGYIKTLGDAKEDTVREKLDEIQQLTRQTLESLYEGRSVETPSFRYHPGTSLLIVTGDSDYMDVARKIINALPGQEKGNRQDLLDTQVPQTQK